LDFTVNRAPIEADSHGAAFKDERKSKRAGLEQRKLPEADAGQLPAQTQTLDQRLVAVAVLVLEIAEKTAALIDHLQKTATRMVILVVIGEVFGQMFDARRKQRNLDLGRARVVGGAAIVRDDLAGLFVRERHLRILKTARLAKSRSAMRVEGAARVRIFASPAGGDSLAAVNKIF
jgi:hypothetical protein